MFRTRQKNGLAAVYPSVDSYAIIISLIPVSTITKQSNPVCSTGSWRRVANLRYK
jgi:hypothetical protein